MRLIDAYNLEREVRSLYGEHIIDGGLYVRRDRVIRLINKAPSIRTDGRSDVVDSVTDRAKRTLVTEATSWRTIIGDDEILVTVTAEVIGEAKHGVD